MTAGGGFVHRYPHKNMFDVDNFVDKWIKIRKIDKNYVIFTNYRGEEEIC